MPETAVGDVPYWAPQLKALPKTAISEAHRQAPEPSLLAWLWSVVPMAVAAVAMVAATVLWLRPAAMRSSAPAGATLRTLGTQFACAMGIEWGLTLQWVLSIVSISMFLHV